MNDISQSFELDSSFLNNGSFQRNLQDVQSKKQLTSIDAVLLESKKSAKYALLLGANQSKTDITSNLFNISESNLVEGTQNTKNKLSYTQKTIYNNGSYSLKFKKFKLSANYNLRYLKQDLNNQVDNIVNESNNLFFEPSLSLKYFINSNSLLNLRSGIDRIVNAEKHLFSNPILVSSRTIESNEPSLDAQKRSSIGLFYFKNNLFNQFEINSSFNYQISRGNFFSDFNINNLTTQIRFFFTPQTNRTINGNFNISKFIPFLESTVKLTNNYNYSSFINIVNDSNFRRNKSYSFLNGISFKTAFDFFLNLENKFTHSTFVSVGDEGGRFTNNSIENISTFKIKINKEWFFLLSNSYLFVYPFNVH